MSEQKSSTSQNFEPAASSPKKAFSSPSRAASMRCHPAVTAHWKAKFSLWLFLKHSTLQDKGMLEVKNNSGETVDFQTLLHCYETQNQNAWVNYLVYRDLRSRGYVVREGFGGGIDFRIYERGSYGKDIAPYLILVTQEGKPLPINDLADALQQCQSQKKELILAVTNRRGEIVHYSVGEMRLPF